MTELGVPFRALIPTPNNPARFLPPSLPALGMLLALLLQPRVVSEVVQMPWETDRQKVQRKAKPQKTFPGPFPNWGAGCGGTIWKKAMINASELIKTIYSEQNEKASCSRDARA